MAWTHEKFIEHVTPLVGDKLDLSRVEYVALQKPVTVICRKDGTVFEMRPQSILFGRSGCPKCPKRPRLTTEEFISRCKAKHGERFDYSNTVYTTMKDKVSVRCIEHDLVFDQLPQQHMKGGVGCPQCHGQTPITVKSFIERARKIHGDQFDYSTVENIKGVHTKVTMRCVKHDETFEQEAWTHIHRGSSGCPSCNHNAPMTMKTLLQKASVVFPDKKYDYSQVDLSRGVRAKVTIVCPVDGHGPFEQTLDAHLNAGKEGCRICDAANRIGTLDQFVARSIRLFGEDKYLYDRAELTHGLSGEIELGCQKHGHYFMCSIFNHLQGHEGCSSCRVSKTSKPENDLADFVAGLGFEVVRHNRKLLGGKEIDIFIPEKNVGIEFNGLYYHSSVFLDKNAHRDKTDKAMEKGVRLLHVWEDDWRDRQGIVKEHIKHVLGVSDSRRVFARSCVVKSVSSSLANSFLADHHIQGSVPSTVRLGLFHGDELVAVSAFTKSGDDFTLVRYATACHVVGGHSRLVSHFEKNHVYDRIITFADHGFSDGGLYATTGWSIDGTLAPDYSYVVAGKRVHKFNFRKDRFKTDDTLIYDESLSESELAAANGLNTVYDCGKTRFVRSHPTAERSHSN